MGLSFDGNGRYVGWSNLFDYYDINTINASEDLPNPKRRIYKLSDGENDVNNYIYQIKNLETSLSEFEKLLVALQNEANKASIGSEEDQLKIPEILIQIKQTKENISNTRVNRIKSYAKFITYLNTLDTDENGYVNIFYSIDGSKEIINNVNSHEFTSIPYSLREDANKNFVSSHIQHTVQNLRNMIGAYSPIEMTNFRKAADNSTKGEQASKMTLFNPATKLLMQYQNITGKNVIGIAANGEKASFMWHFYINDIVRHYNQDKAKYAKFNFETKRILNRSKGDKIPEQVTVNTLPDVNFEGIDPSIINEFGTQLENPITVDLMISQILSAATDNAKELILAKVNAGNKLAKMYLFLVTLGFDINDVVAFMTSPIASFIDTITEDNMFIGQSLDIPTAIRIARGDYKNLYKRFLSTSTWSNLSKETKEKLDSGKIDGIINEFDSGSIAYNEFENLLTEYSQINYLRNFELNEDTLADIDEFENVLEGANEFSNLGRALGANQGLPTSKVDLQSKVQFLQDVLKSRIEEVNKKRKENKQEEINEDLLDVQKYLTDPEYKQHIKDVYESVKKCSNVFDIIDSISQYKAIFSLFSCVIDIDNSISVKTRAYNKIFNKLKLEGYYVSDDYQKRLLKGIDDAIISDFILNSNISIPYTSGSTLLNELRQTYEVPEDGELKFTSLCDVASFKYLFENTIIPMLKKGEYYDFKSEYTIDPKTNEKIFVRKKISKIIDQSISSNKFIQSLIKGNDKEKPLYKCNLNMMTIDNSQDNKIRFQQYMKGLSELSSIAINGTKLSDLFVLYNLIVNKNQYGSDRMTKLFDSLISNNGNLSLIKKYLAYVGNLDYYEYNHELNISYIDVLKRAAKVVTSEVGQTDPTIILNTDKGPELLIRDGFSYVTFSEIIPNLEGESDNDYFERIFNHNSYFVLGGNYKDAVDIQCKNIRELNNELQATIQQLMKDGNLIIYNNCQ